MAAPDDRRAQSHERADEAGGLGVVHDDHVARRHHAGELADVRLERGRRRSPRSRRRGRRRRRARRAGCCGCAWSTRRSPGCRRSPPSARHADAAGVGEERHEHLRHAAAARGRVHVPDDPPGEQIARAIGGVGHLPPLPRFEDVLELARRAAHRSAPTPEPGLSPWRRHDVTNSQSENGWAYNVRLHERPPRRQTALDKLCINTIRTLVDGRASRRPTPAIRARRWRWRPSPTCSTRGR